MQTITATNGSTTVKLVIGQNQYIVNGLPKTLDVPPKILRGSTLIPFRAVVEAFGAKVNWNQDNSTVIITSKGAVVENPSTPPSGSNSDIPKPKPPVQQGTIKLNRLSSDQMTSKVTAGMKALGLQYLPESKGTDFLTFLTSDQKQFTSYNNDGSTKLVVSGTATTKGIEGVKLILKELNVPLTTCSISNN